MECAKGGSEAALPLAPINSNSANYSNKYDLVPTEIMDTLQDVAVTVEVQSSPPAKKVPETANLYQVNASGPYIVYVQFEPPTSASEEADKPRNSTINPIALGKTIFDQKVRGIEHLKKIGRNRVEIAFKSGKEANAFTTLTFLKDRHLKAYIPTYTTFRTGLIKGIDTSLSDQEIIDGFNECNSIRVHKVRRLNYRDKSNGEPVWKPSRSIVVTFEGQRLPERIFLFYNSLVVESYALPVVQCFNCCRFGHSRVSCRAKTPRCFKCAGEHTGTECRSEAINCANCSSHEHYANNFSCEEYVRQKKIKHLMSTDNMSYFDAASRCPKKPLFTSIVSSYTPTPRVSVERTQYRPRIIVTDPPRAQNQRGQKKRKVLLSPPPPASPSPSFTWDYFPSSDGTNGRCLNNPHRNPFSSIRSLLKDAEHKVLNMQSNCLTSPSLATSSIASLLTVLQTAADEIGAFDGGNPAVANPS